MPARRIRRRPRRRVARRGARRIPRSLVPKSPQMARIKETIQFVDFLPNTSYLCAFNLAQFERANALALYFRWIKPAKVTWQFEPLYNTYQESGTVGVYAPGVPYFYYAMNRTQDAHIYTLSDLQAQGSKPKKFSSKITISYKPNWCSPGLIVQGQTNNSVIGLRNTGLKPEYGWTQSSNSSADNSANMDPAIPSTIDGNTFNPQTGLTPDMTGNLSNQVLYNGHDIFISQPNGIDTQRVCRCTCTVEWIFKDPNNATGVAQERAQPVQRDTTPSDDTKL